MAITIDQFLHDLTERRALSGEELSAVRRELTAHAREPASDLAPNRGETSSESSGQASTATATAPLVLCDCFITERIHDEADHLIFQARRIEDDSPVTLHVFMPGGGDEFEPFAPSRTPESQPAIFMGIVNVERQGEMICVCCETIESDTLEDIVREYDRLPLDLATETLLQTVYALKRWQERGLKLAAVSPEQLLLDDDGRIHLAGESPSGRIAEPWRLIDEPIPPSVDLLQSLGRLYDYLQWGKAGRSAEDSNGEAEGVSVSAATVVRERLLGKAGAGRYDGWDDLIRDLETLLEGGEASPSRESLTSQTADEIETPAKRVPAGPTNPVRSKTSRRWLLFAFALLTGVILAAWTMLKD